MRDSDEEQIRIDLAATFRIIAHLGMHEAVANHFSAALSAQSGARRASSPSWRCVCGRSTGPGGVVAGRPGIGPAFWVTEMGGKSD